MLNTCVVFMHTIRWSTHWKANCLVVRIHEAFVPELNILGVSCQPLCSVESVATSTSSSERLSPLRSSSWHTDFSAAPDPGHGSPTFLENTDCQTHDTRLFRSVSILKEHHMKSETEPFSFFQVLQVFMQYMWHLCMNVNSECLT